MKVVALVSGGKDSCYAMMKCIQYGHQIVALANLLPADDSVDELDSYMYQTVGHQIIVKYAECMGVPLFRRRIQGSTRHQNLSYRKTPGDEVEDMFILLSEIKRQIPSITAVSSGAIASDYQRLRVESICSRLGLVSLAYLWKQDQSMLLEEMIANDISAILVKVAAMGLEPSKHLGKDISFMEPYLHKLRDLYGINVCGEGGEYETLTLDCPLFINARIVLDDFQIIPHSLDSIAPVGVLHPLKFHLENKEKSNSFRGSDEQKSFVVEVEGDCLQRCESLCHPIPAVNNFVEATQARLCLSKTKKDGAFSICCWLQDAGKPTTGLEEDLKTVLKEIKLQISGHGLGWEHVLYIHLYISDMNDFSVANETYVKFITQEKCQFGVPSRSTIELPLDQAGLGKAYVEVLLASDNSKQVLHVQSISCWAPSIIGPYSQATLHKEILHMAGQLGLDPPTMNLCDETATTQLKQALKNSEAIANSYNCSISTSAIFFVIYCSTRISSSERLDLHEKLETFLEQLRSCKSYRRTSTKVLEPIYLYVLVPDLPKRALVEIKPLLYIDEGIETTDETLQHKSCIMQSSFGGIQAENWHDSCIQKCIVGGKIFAIVLSISKEFAMKICTEPEDNYQNNTDHNDSLTDGQLVRVSTFCIYLLDKVLVGNGFSWEDTTTLRIYLSTRLNIAMETLSGMFADSFSQLARTGQNIKDDKEPVFNLVPVIGAGRSAASMDSIITCELFAQKS